MLLSADEIPLFRTPPQRLTPEGRALVSKKAQTGRAATAGCGDRSGADSERGGAWMSTLEFIDRALALVSSAQAWLLAQPPAFQILVGTVALAVFWVLWIVLRVSLVAFWGLGGQAHSEGQGRKF